MSRSDTIDRRCRACGRPYRRGAYGICEGCWSLGELDDGWALRLGSLVVARPSDLPAALLPASLVRRLGAQAFGRRPGDAA